MFKHLLIPTDGSECSQRAVDEGVRLAQRMDAKITFLTAIPEFYAVAYQMEVLDQTDEAYLEAAQAQARKILDAARAAADKAGVECETQCTKNSHPYEAIIAAAGQKQCDLIVMASHGRRGLEGILIGSETQKVLTHCKLPVLVLR